MTIKEFAEMLNGRCVRKEITTEEEKLADELRYVVVFGYSDDLAEFRGAIEDEIDCFDGGRIFSDGSKYIDAVWCDGGKYCWSYKTNIPIATFDIYEDEKCNELYCQGIVFSLKDTIDKPDNDRIIGDSEKFYSLETIKNVIMDCIGKETVSKYADSEMCKLARSAMESIIYALEEIAPENNDELMRKFQIPHIKADVLSQNRFIPEETAEFIAERYLEGRYDCNLSYWDNINNLIKENCEDIELLAYDIEWDTDEEDIELPTEVVLPEGMIDENEITDYLSDLTHFCHYGFKVKEFDRESVFKSLINTEGIDLLNKLDNLSGAGQISDRCYETCLNKEFFKQIEEKIFSFMQERNEGVEEFANPYFYMGLAEKYQEDAFDAKDFLSAEIYNCDILYMVAIADVLGLERPKTEGDFLEIKE